MTPPQSALTGGQLPHRGAKDACADGVVSRGEFMHKGGIMVKNYKMLKMETKMKKL